MFKIFRFVLIIFSLACTVLSIFALTGSYANKSYLTNTYLLNFHLTHANLSAIIDTSGISKRDLSYSASDIGNVLQDATVTPGQIQQIQTTINNIVSTFTYSELGLADVYQIGYWGYCKGYVLKEETYSGSGAVGNVLKSFDNSQVNYTWCSSPTPAFAFDPLEIFKTEIGNKINNTIQGANPFGFVVLNQEASSSLQVLLDNINWDTLNLPGDLKKDLSLLQNLTKASFGIILAVAVLSFVSVLLQFLGCCFSPDNCCLSFLNFIYEFIIFILAIISAAFATGVYYYVRREVNNNTVQYGIKSFLSINFYAFLWAAVVAALLVVIFNLLGHCCGLFGTGRRRYRAVPPPAAYEHEFKGEM
ncbi:actin cortical patch SUR7/pH-response regulator pali [Scheffersomyces amazonensis]|uniref:actin cortical patch SUR7/pH-response regulator pali n=1 Tax=Scheffersomyces amazonensis TaxID=1078765 RepID=UPI00315DD33D